MQIKPLESLVLETSALCQLHCSHCPGVTMRRPRGLMDFALFEKILDGAPYLTRLGLSGWGEPLLNPDLFDMIQIAKKDGIGTVLFSTNGVLLKEYTDDILLSDLDILRVSLEGAQQAQVRGTGEVEEHLRHFLAERDAGGFEGPRVEVLCTVTPESTFLEAFRQEWEARGAHVLFQPIIGAQYGPRMAPCQEFYGKHGGRLVVLWDGRVVPCCMDVEGEMVVGNARRQTLVEIWEGRGMTALRGLPEKGLLPHVCLRCNEYDAGELAPKRFEEETHVVG